MLHRQPPLRAPVASDTSLFITFKGLGAYDYPSSFAWPPPQDVTAWGSGEVASSHEPRSSPSVNSSDYSTHYRSPFSVLRSRQSRVNRCASGMLGASFDMSTRYLLSGNRDAPCSNPFCCCSALMYPLPRSASSSSSVAPVHTEAMERVRDDFLWSLRIGGVEDLLKSTLGTELHARLLRELGASPSVAVVLACSDPIRMAQLVACAAVDAAEVQEGNGAAATSGAYVARLLLSADEDNRIRWLQEESAAMEPSDYYSRAPSLRALFVMWSVLLHLQRTRSTYVLGSGAGVGGHDGKDRWDGAAPSAATRFEGGGLRVQSPTTARSPSSLVPCPQMSEIRHVLLRMGERRLEVCMSDIAALAALGASGTGATAVPDSDFWDSLAKQLQPQEVAAAVRTPAATAATASTSAETLGLQHILLLCLLLRYVLLVRAEVTNRDATSALSQSHSKLAARNKMLLPITAFEAASDIIQLRKNLTGQAAVESGVVSGLSAAIRDALVALSDVVLRHAYEMAEASHISSSSPHLPELTTWLLREMVASPACKFHFKRLVDRSITEALVALEKSGLVNRSTINLEVVVRQLLPLLESCGSENLYTSVLRDVLSALEEKARRDGYAFSAQDLEHLAELGTQLFSSGPSDSTNRGLGLFDETARGQMEELHVMNGSPWALCVFSYRSLKEMLQGIVRDQRRLRDQVQDQLRQLSNASSLTAVMTGTKAKEERGATVASEQTQPTLSVEGSVPDPAAPPTQAGAEQPSPSETAAEASAAREAPAPPPRIPVPPMLRQRFLVLIEELVKSQVDESSTQSERSIVISSELFAFVTQHVPVPNIQDEYRRKIFLLVNVAEDPETTRVRMARRRRERRIRQRAAESESHGPLRQGARRRGKGDVASAECGGEEDESVGGGVDVANQAEEAAEVGMDLHGGANDIPAELRFLVSSLPLTLSPWASVMILREVLAESAGRNPRYTYVLNAAIDLQLPISTTRSRIATTLNMWRFLTTQSHKLSLKESLVMKQRCAWNLPLAYILSSYWSLLTWLTLASIVALNVVGIDWESQIVANSLFRMFAPWEEIGATPSDEESAEEAWTTQAAADLAADYFEQAEIADRRREEHLRSSTNVFLSSASYLILGYDDQRRPMTVIPIGSDRTKAPEKRVAEEYAAATAVLRELSLHAPFPFFVDVERALPLDLVESRIAERIRRVSFNNTWFLPRMIIRTFPLGRQYTEHKLILHTCTQANLTRRRVTFLLYMHDGVAITPQFIQKLNESPLSRQANLVLVAHESSLLKGGTTPALLAKVSRADSSRGTTGGADSLEGIASAAADIVESVIPEEEKEKTSANNGSASAVDRHVRVLPFCRQYYQFDGTVAADAVRSKEEGSHVSPVVPDMDNGEWWRRWLPSWAGGFDVAKAEAAAAAAAARAAAAPTSLPLFASAFSDQRTSLHRSHQKQCEMESDAATRLRQQQQQQQQASGGGIARGVARLRRWPQWWMQTLSAALGAPGRTMRVTRDGSREEAATADSGEETLRGAGTTAAASTVVAPPGESHDGSDYPSGFQDDAVEDKAGKDVISVSFTAMRRLMADVSAPVPIPRKRHGSPAGGGSNSNNNSSAIDETPLSSAAVSESESGSAAVTATAREPEPKPSPASTLVGTLPWPWSALGGVSSTAETVSLKKREEMPAPVAASPTSSASLVVPRKPYSFTHHHNSTSTTTSATPAAASSASSNSHVSPIGGTERAAAAATSDGASSLRRRPDASDSAPSSHLASSLSFSSLPTAGFGRQNSFTGESEWRKADELLAQLRRTTRPNT